MSKIICVVGPTASGKTALAVELALALNGEVVSADAMQIYKRLDIGTAKPTADEMRGVPHHMISIVEPWEEYSVARYVVRASAVIDDIVSREKMAILTGGTGLYADSLVKGLDFSNARENDRIRERLSSMYDRFGGARMLRLLVRLDGDAAARLHANDKKRVVRALEVAFSGGSISAHDHATKERPSRYDALYIGLSYSDRDELYRRCDARVDAMLAAGLMDEVRLVKEHAAEWKTAAAAIGYKELFDGTADDLKRATRRYAKRQLTWFRRNAGIKWFMRDEMTDEQLLHDSTEYARAFLYNQDAND